MFSLSGKNALITGGGAVGSMGHAVALCLARQGCNICLVDIDVDLFAAENNATEQASPLDAAVASLSEFGRLTMGVRADCTQEKEVERAFSLAIAKLGSVDIAVACVGGGGLVKGKQVKTAGNYTDVADQTTEEYMKILSTTQFSTYFTCRCAASHMRDRGQGGRIVIIGSVMANMAAKGSTAYSGSKAAIRQMGKVMANELGGVGVTVNTIQPGWMQTKGEMRQTGKDDEYYQQQAASIPCQRMGTAMDIGAAVAFLASDEASYVNGACIDVDGGFTAALALPPPPASDAAKL